MPAVVGFDTETFEGLPNTVQFYSDDIPRINGCLFVNETNVAEKFLKHISKHCKGAVCTLYAHNLKFDLVTVLFPHYEKLASRYGDYKLSHREFLIKGVYGRPTFTVLNNHKTGTTVYLLDTFSWFMTSAAKAASLVCPHRPKLEHPDGLGHKRITPKDTLDIEYGMRDAEIAYHLGKAIDNMHREFDLQPCVSVASMASSIFSQHYISEKSPIWNCGPDFNKGAVASYHGGKNNVIPDAAPAWHYGIDAWDLSSAYPHAMTHLPAFSDPKLFRHALIFPKKTQRFPDHGIYCVSGKTPPCHWPVVFDEGFNPIRGPFEKQWFTGWELNEALRADEIKIDRVFGHVYDTDKDPVTDTAFSRYVFDFYEKKQTATDPVLRTMYKVLLNSLYGKFIQSREIATSDGGVGWKHGPLYHPFAASLVTGHTRAVMHRLEHETQALHTATDGVFCGMGNSPKNGVFDWAPQSGIGAIESEGRDLELCLMRNKMYLAYTDEQKGIESWLRPGKHILKFAKHGCQAQLPAMEKMAITGIRNYVVNKPNTLKIAVKQGKTPNKFERHLMTLNVGSINRHVDHRVS